MKKNYIIFLLILSLLSGCNNVNKESTTINSSTSFIESDSIITSDSETKEIIEVQNTYTLDEITGIAGLTPSTGDINILLIPIHFSDVEENKLDLSLINKAFNSQDNNDIEWFSVASFYNKSSYGKLNLNFDITSVFTPSKKAIEYSSAYSNLNYTKASEEILNEALINFDNQYDYNKYDYNNDGYIDGVYLIYDYDVDFSYQKSLWWAYTSYFSDEKITFDNKKIKSYVFAGFDFLKQNKQMCNTHTLIHEMAHMFGIDDYYDYDTSKGQDKGGLAKGDLMDGTLGDHNPFTKSLLNWNKGRLISPKTSINIDLSAFAENGDYLILANDFAEYKGILQEYFILEYYTPTSLNEFDKIFKKPGIRVLHINAKSDENNKLLYNNSFTLFKLISQITSSKGATYINSTAERTDYTLFLESKSLTEVKFSDNSKLNYTFTVDKLDTKNANITINKIN